MRKKGRKNWEKYVNDFVELSFSSAAQTGRRLKPNFIFSLAYVCARLEIILFIITCIQSRENEINFPLTREDARFFPPPQRIERFARDNWKLCGICVNRGRGRKKFGTLNNLICFGGWARTSGINKIKVGKVGKSGGGLTRQRHHNLFSANKR